MNRFLSVLSRQSSLPLLSLIAALAASGCASKVVVQPVIPRDLTATGARPASLSLYVDPAVAAYTHVASTATGDVALGTIHIEYRVGKALVATIKDAAQASFRHVVAVETKSCAAGTGGVLGAKLARPPEIHAHWGGDQGVVGGGTIADIALDLTMLSCSGKEVWQGTAVGHGDADEEQEFSNWPDADDFRPGMNAALQDLARNLTAALSTARMP